LQVILEYARFEIHGNFIRAIMKANNDTPQLRYPIALSISGDFLAICEYQAHRFQLWNYKDWKCCYTIGTYGDDQDQFQDPTDILIYNNEIFICDTGNHRIQVRNLNDGKYLRMWGEKGEKPGQLLSPRSLAILEKEIFIFESRNYRISVFHHQTGNYIRSWGNKGKEDGEFGYDSRKIAHCYMCLYHNELYITDNVNNRIQVFNPLNGKFIRKLDTYSLNRPQGILIIDNEVYVSETGNNCISVITPDNGKLIRKWGTQGDTENQFNNPLGMVLTAEGQLIIADRDNNRLQIFS